MPCQLCDGQKKYELEDEILDPCPLCKGTGEDQQDCECEYPFDNPENEASGLDEVYGNLNNWFDTEAYFDGAIYIMRCKRCKGIHALVT